MKQLTPTDIANAALELDVPAPCIQAVLKVETNGSGFLEDGRPTILFESKTFGRLTFGKYHQTHPNLSTVKWDRTTYGKGGAHQYDRLEIAKTLDKEAALKSCSWGLFQIMGENYRACGFKDVESFVAAMYESPGEQLKAFCKFVIRNERMHEALKVLDWATFARYYNGPGYKENSYDIKLAKAYAEYSKE
jgi:hypothetical protein